MQKIEEVKKNILICPLNWGLGHATRCVPIIRAASELGHNVIIAADKAPLDFLKNEFPDLQFIKLPGFEPTYSKGDSQIFKLLQSIPNALTNFKKEHLAIEKIVENTKDVQCDVLVVNKFLKKFLIFPNKIYIILPYKLKHHGHLGLPSSYFE